MGSAVPDDRIQLNLHIPSNFRQVKFQFDVKLFSAIHKVQLNLNILNYVYKQLAGTWDFIDSMKAMKKSKVETTGTKDLWLSESQLLHHEGWTESNSKSLEGQRAKLRCEAVISHCMTIWEPILISTATINKNQQCYPHVSLFVWCLIPFQEDGVRLLQDRPPTRGQDLPEDYLRWFQPQSSRRKLAHQVLFDGRSLKTHTCTHIPRSLFMIFKSLCFMFVA